ncbi:MAG: ureidoglycolate lyase [Candidatus Binataceae bacterium]
MEARTIRLKLRPLTAEAFSAYGKVLESKQPLLPEVEPGEGRIAIEILRLKRPSDSRRIEGMAVHFSYNQTFIPVRGGMALIVAPPPRNREAGHEHYELDYERMAAFVVEPGHGAFIEKGTWHSAMAIGTECQFVNVTRKNPGEATSDLSLERGFARIPEFRPYVEVLNFRKRDNRVIELEL